MVLWIMKHLCIFLIAVFKNQNQCVNEKILFKACAWIDSWRYMYSSQCIEI